MVEIIRDFGWVAVFFLGLACAFFVFVVYNMMSNLRSGKKARSAPSASHQPEQGRATEVPQGNLFPEATADYPSLLVVAPEGQPIVLGDFEALLARMRFSVLATENASYIAEDEDERELFRIFNVSDDGLFPDDKEALIKSVLFMLLWDKTEDPLKNIDLMLSAAADVAREFDAKLQTAEKKPVDLTEQMLSHMRTRVRQYVIENKRRHPPNTN